SPPATTRQTAMGRAGAIRAGRVGRTIHALLLSLLAAGIGPPHRPGNCVSTPNGVVPRTAAPRLLAGSPSTGVGRLASLAPDLSTPGARAAGAPMACPLG